MTDTYSCMLLRHAEENDDGDLIYELKRPGPAGATQTHDVNVTHIFRPGIRKTSNMFILAHEAELAADGKEIKNPAFPTTTEVADELQDRLDDEIEPAYIECRPHEFP